MNRESVSCLCIHIAYFNKLPVALNIMTSLVEKLISFFSPNTNAFTPQKPVKSGDNPLFSLLRYYYAVPHMKQILDIYGIFFKKQ